MQALWPSPDTPGFLVTWSVSLAWELADSQPHPRPIGSDSQRVRPSGFFSVYFIEICLIYNVVLISGFSTVVQLYPFFISPSLTISFLLANCPSFPRFSSILDSWDAGVLFPPPAHSNEALFPKPILTSYPFALPPLP